MFQILRSFLFLALIVLAWSCTYNNEEDLYPQAPCDTVNITFTADIKPIFEANCVVCHSGPNPAGGHDYTTHQGIVDAVDAGHLMPAIRHDNGFIPMPKDRDKLPECPINQIQAWINLGMPNN